MHATAQRDEDTSPLVGGRARVSAPVKVGYGSRGSSTMARTDEGGRPRYLEGSGLRLVLSTLCADWGGQAAVGWPATRRHHPPLGRSHSPPRSCIPATMRLRTPKAAVRLARLRWARIGDICRLARAVTTSLTPMNPRRDSQVFTMVARFTSGVGSPATSQ